MALEAWAVVGGTGSQQKQNLVKDSNIRCYYSCIARTYSTGLWFDGWPDAKKTRGQQRGFVGPEVDQKLTCWHDNENLVCTRCKVMAGLNANQSQIGSAEPARRNFPTTRSRWTRSKCTPVGIPVTSTPLRPSHVGNKEIYEEKRSLT